MTIATASGKAILFGEHAVVYGRPAIAVPIGRGYVRAEIRPAPNGQGIRVEAPDLGRVVICERADPDDPLSLIVMLTLKKLGLLFPQSIVITVRSELPVARGLGSGAAVSTAIVRALAAYFSKAISPAVVSELVFETEKLYHGHPSGIDNTVIAFEQPVYFVQGRPPEILRIGTPFTLLIADTGIPSSTREVVNDVRRARDGDRTHYETLFDAIGRLTEAGRAAIEAGDIQQMGGLMNENHSLLQALGVSCPELDILVEAACAAGALGAKLCGAGRGGNMIALPAPENEQRVLDALTKAGAMGIISARLGAS